jgi:prephenate dehydrogenase
MDGVAAVKVGAVTDLANSAKWVVPRVDLLVLAAPPRANVRLLEELRAPIAKHGVLVTDVSSVKGAIVKAAEAAGVGGQFAGSHPLCGTHRTGFEGAQPDLYRGALVYVTPTGEGQEVARETADFWERVLGSSTVVLDSALHDEFLAWTSHLPHAVSSALAVTLSRDAPRGLSFGTGARDTTRLAAGSVEMWRDIFMTNRENTAAALDHFERSIRELRGALETGASDAVAAWLEEGARFRRELDA